MGCREDQTVVVSGGPVSVTLRGVTRAYVSGKTEAEGYHTELALC